MLSVHAARLASPLLLLAACSRAPEEPTRAGGPAAGQPVFSREAFAPAARDAGAVDLPVPATPDPRALDEILASAPRTAPSVADLDGGLGSETGLPAEASSARAPAAEANKGVQVRVGKVTTEPGMSSPAIERAARAELYWPLVQRCRDAGGGILPPEVVHLTFQLDSDGYVVPATILAVPKDPRFADAARCMARELTMVTFRAPPGARGMPRGVAMDVPSVD